MDLRDLTRETEQARLGMKRVAFEDLVDELLDEQIDLTERTAQVIEDILALPDAEADFGRELGLLNNAKTAMDDVETHMMTPTAGPVTIAAETEAIEYLLDSRRGGKGGGGGGGSTPGGGGLKKGQTDASALALVGRSEDPNGVVSDREVGSGVGASEAQQSAELRASLDRYFEKLNGK